MIKPKFCEECGYASILKLRSVLNVLRRSIDTKLIEIPYRSHVKNAFEKIGALEGSHPSVF